MAPSLDDLLIAGFASGINNELIVSIIRIIEIGSETNIIVDPSDI